MKRADLQGWLKARQRWMQKASPADHSAPVLDRRGAEDIAAQDEQAFATLKAAWAAAPDLRAAWTNATDPARERFTREVLQVSAAPAAPLSQGQ